MMRPIASPPLCRKADSNARRVGSISCVGYELDCGSSDDPIKPIDLSSLTLKRCATVIRLGFAAPLL